MKRIRMGRAVLPVLLAASVMTACGRNRDAGTERSTAAQTESAVYGTADEPGADGTAGETSGRTDAGGAQEGTNAEGTGIGDATGGTGNSVNETSEGVIRGLVDDAENAVRDMTRETPGGNRTAGEDTEK